MPVPVPPRPHPFGLAQCAVGRPVSAAHGRRSCFDLAFLLAQSIEQYADVGFDYDVGATSPLDVAVFATRSPGVAAWLIGAELREVDSGTATIAVTDDGAALTWIEPGGLDGATTLVTPPANVHRRPVIFGVADVTAFPTDTTVKRLRIRYTRGSNAIGLRRVFVRGIPQSAVGPAEAPATEVSANAAWPYPRRGLRDGLVDGGASEAFGFVRLEDQCEQARTKVRIHRQWCTYEDDTYAAQTSSTTIGPLTWTTGWGAGDDAPLVTRARRTRGTTAATAQPETARPVIRYKCSDSGGGTVRVVANGTNYDKAVAAAANWTTLELADVLLPTDQAGQRVEVYLHGAVASAGVLRIATFDLFTRES